MSESCVVRRFERCSWGGRRRHPRRAYGIEATGVMLQGQQRCQDGKNDKSPNVFAPTLHRLSLAGADSLAKAVYPGLPIRQLLTNCNFITGVDVSRRVALYPISFRDLTGDESNLEVLTGNPSKLLIPRGFWGVMSILPPRRFQ